MEDVDEEPRLHGEPITYTDGRRLGVETCRGTVRLVTRDVDGDFLEGVMLMPTDAYRLAEALQAGAFAAKQS